MLSLTNKHIFCTNDHCFLHQHLPVKLPEKSSIKIGLSIISPGKPTLEVISYKIVNSRDGLEPICLLSYCSGKLIENRLDI